MLSLGLGLYPALFFMSISLSGPILEKWLLSGEAIHKNISIGGGGLTQLTVPEGKTFIVTKIEMLPFANIIDPFDVFAIQTSLTEINPQTLEGILKRIQFQLLFYGQRINSVYNIRNKFYINTYENSGATQTAPGVSFEKHSFETFHIVEDSCWLYLKYFDFDTVGFITQVTTDYYQLAFDGSQNWPPTPYYGYEDQSDITGINNINTPVAFNYFPQGYTQPSSSSIGSNQFILPNKSIALDPIQNSSFIPPIQPQNNADIESRWMPSIPFYNISVIEINRRLSTNGLL